MGASVGYSASMKERERLLDMLDRMHDGDAWHGPSVMNIVRTLPAADAEARPLAGAHTIGEIARHVVGWRDEVRERMGGKAPALPACGDWPPPSAGGWTATLADLDRSHRQLRDAIVELPQSRWDAMVGPSREAGLGAGVSYARMLHGIIQHDAYHAGQMALLKKALA
jgi:uncharacterized damage-inducible protein DinB